jgi:ribosomal protein S18
LEEPSNLEISLSNNLGIPRAGQPLFSAPLLELEYGVKAWWTAEFYLEGQSREGDSTIFTGWRLENRFRPLAREHRINPVLYFEYENVNEASRITKEVVGHASSFDEPNADLRRAHAHELEAKLILSSTVRDWNISENFIVEKNLTENEGYEFGYAVGVWRPLAKLASGKPCRFCRENITYIDYKDTQTLQKLVTTRGKMLSRKRSGKREAPSDRPRRRLCIENTKN